MAQRRTHHTLFRIPILKSLLRRGGRAWPQDVRQDVFEAMKDVLGPYDFETVRIKGDAREPIWWNQTREAADKMRKPDPGLLEKTGRGNPWAMSEKGRQFLAGLEPDAQTLPLEDTLNENEIRLAIRKHRKREWKLRQGKIEEALRSGRLVCEVSRCEFDFFVTYGELGQGFAHVHHNTPLAASKGPVQTSLDQLTVVCPNCHEMTHRWMRLHPNQACPLGSLIVNA